MLPEDPLPVVGIAFEVGLANERNGFGSADIVKLSSRCSLLQA